MSTLIQIKTFVSALTDTLDQLKEIGAQGAVAKTLKLF